MKIKSIFVISIDFESFKILPVTNKQKEHISIIEYIFYLFANIYCLLIILIKKYYVLESLTWYIHIYIFGLFRFLLDY